jgi:hypothetical protein
MKLITLRHLGRTVKVRETTAIASLAVIAWCLNTGQLYLYFAKQQLNKTQMVERFKKYFDLSKFVSFSDRISSNYSLTFYSLAVTLHTTRFNIKNFTWCPHCVYVFCTDLRTNSNFCLIKH